MPIYNEAPARVFGTVHAIFEDVEATGHGAAFDWFFLSDTTNPEIFVAEERAFVAMRRGLGPSARVFYRHRPKNLARKAGNITDFVTRWGGHYDHMVVLDADSMMTGEAIVGLAAAMEADPGAGIIQTLPLIINRNTLFARVQQFAARIYGPVIAAGLAAWMGRDGNYWGHNAIIRTQAFAAHCGLPALKGRPPFGGHVLSHDFVEAALILRAGYSVYMLPGISGSYEESPPSLIDTSERDRRWCQGNLQHSRILPAKGLHWASRQHLAAGIMGYVASPLWMLQLLVGIVIVFQASYIRPEYFTSEFTLFPTWPRFDAERSLALFALTMAILLTPKVFGLVLALLRGPVRRGCGGALRLVVSTVFETIMSALLAPIMMLIQSGHVVHFVFGFDTGWNPQRRDDGSIPFMAHRAPASVACRHGRLEPDRRPSDFSLPRGLDVADDPRACPGDFHFMGDGATVLRDLFAACRVFADARRKIETARRAPRQQARQGNSPIWTRLPIGLKSIHAEPEFRAIHKAFLPQEPPRRRGEISVERALADAKLDEARSIDEAIDWLRPNERMVVLLDPDLLARLVALPKQAPFTGGEQTPQA